MSSATIRSRVAKRRTCTNTCFKANDGVCDEARPISKGGKGKPAAPLFDNKPVVPLLCDLGTDCSDCGSWEGPIPQGW